MDNFMRMLTGFENQLIDASTLGKDIKFNNVNKVLICGIGGSALPGDIIKSLFFPLPFELSINRTYHVPKYIDQSYLCICISYSGNTEETVSMYKELIKKTKKIVVITSGGKLEKLAKKNNTPLILVSKGLQPRLAFGYQTFPAINVMNNCKIINFDLSKEIRKVKKSLKFDFKTNAKKLASKLKNKIILTYSSTSNFILSKKWKIAFNENSKTMSCFNHFPESNHNEINGFNNTNTKNLISLMLVDNKDHARIKKRFKIISKLMKKKGIKIIEVPVWGSGKLSRLYSNLIYSDWVSYYLAKLYKQDPEKVPIIENLKKELKK